MAQTLLSVLLRLLNRSPATATSLHRQTKAAEGVKASQHKPTSRSGDLCVLCALRVLCVLCVKAFAFAFASAFAFAFAFAFALVVAVVAAAFRRAPLFLNLNF